MQLMASWLPLPTPALRRLLSSQFQGGEAFTLSRVHVGDDQAIGGVLKLRDGRATGVCTPKRRGGRRPLLKIHGLSLVLEQQFSVGSFQDLHPEAGIAGPL